MNYPKLYLEKIHSGEEVVSEKVKVVYEREVGWMLNPPEDFPYYFDEQEGIRHIEFVERFCKHSKGKFAGKNIYLFLRAILNIVAFAALFFGLSPMAAELGTFATVLTIAGAMLLVVCLWINLIAPFIHRKK